MKKLGRYADPQRWSPKGSHTMQQSENGGYVREEEYAALLQELKGERLRLKRAGELVAALVRNA